MKYVASLSCGKDSLAMVLRLMEENRPLTHCIFFDAGMEFGAIYCNIEKIRPLLTDYGCELVILKPRRSFLTSALIKPIHGGKENGHYGYGWCGGCTRWMTRTKATAMDAYKASLGECVEYIGIAADEASRASNKTYPLIEWGMTEADCLQYCRDRGWNWLEGDIDLYDVMDRVSCWCCRNKNLKELRNMYHLLPEYWELLKGMQSRIDRPFRKDGTIFDLEERFKREDKQMTLFDEVSQ